VNTLVVGRYQRDTNWTTGLPPGWDTAIVTKDEDVPNEGREPASFLWWIHRHYPRIRRSWLYAFVQDDALNHDPELFHHLAQPATGFRWLGDPSYTSDGDGMPHHGGLPVARLHRRWTGRDFPGHVHFAAGGQFMLPGRLLLAHRRSFYEDLRQDVCVGEQAWVLERLWEQIFTLDKE
jgi:hypothetical protein